MSPTRPAPVAAVAALAGILGGCAPSLPVGGFVPSWSLGSTEGETFSADQLRGRPGMLVWIDPMCPEVQRAAQSDGALRRMESRWMQTDSAWVLYVAARTRSDEVMEPPLWRPWMKESKLRGAVLVDSAGSLARLLGVETVPSAAVVDPDGYLRWRGPLRPVDEAGNPQASLVLDSLLHGNALPAPDPGPDRGCSTAGRPF